MRSGGGDLRLFDRILKDLRGYPAQNPDPHARLGREVTEAWKRQCAYLCVKGMFVRKEYDSAYAAASMLLNFDSRKDVLSAFPVYEKLV